MRYLDFCEFLLNSALIVFLLPVSIDKTHPPHLLTLLSTVLYIISLSLFLVRLIWYMSKCNVFYILYISVCVYLVMMFLVF